LGARAIAKSRKITIDTSPMHSPEQPWLQKQAPMLTGRAAHGPPPSARTFRRLRNAARYTRAFVRELVVNPGVLWRETERTILRGKMRRALIACVPGLALRLKRKHGLTGGCVSCGTSCNLLFKCPHWDADTRLCSIYEDRPNTCRLFPITPADLRDRDLASKDKPCGYSFAPKHPPPPERSQGAAKR
jgi:Fe-S-cluster containining protein